MNNLLSDQQLGSSLWNVQTTAAGSPVRQPSNAAVAGIVRLGLLWTGRHRLAGLETPTEKSGRHGHAADQQPGNWRRDPQGLGQTTPRSYPNVFLPPLIEGQVDPAFTGAIGPQVAFLAQRVLPHGGVNRIEEEVALVISSRNWHEDLHALADSLTMYKLP